MVLARDGTTRDAERDAGLARLGSGRVGSRPSPLHRREPPVQGMRRRSGVPSPGCSWRTSTSYRQRPRVHRMSGPASSRRHLVRTAGRNLHRGRGWEQRRSRPPRRRPHELESTAPPWQPSYTMSASHFDAYVVPRPNLRGRQCVDLRSHKELSGRGGVKNSAHLCDVQPFGGRWDNSGGTRRQSDA